MKHKDIENLIQKSLDHEINKENEKMLNSHLAHCHDCQQFYQELALTSQMLGELIEVFPAPGFNDRILRTLGFKKAYAWAQAASILAGVWLGSVLFLLLSPLPKQVFNQSLTTVPFLMRFLEKAEIVLSSIVQLLAPLTKISVNFLYPLMAIILSSLLFYGFSRIINPVRKFSEDIKHSVKSGDF